MPLGRKALVERVRSLLDSVGLTAAADRPSGTYSGGMQRRLGIAQALIHSPRLVIVDEPTAGLDPEERIRFRGLITDVAEQTAVYTRKGCERCIRWAFELTRKRNNPKGKMLTLVAKTNVLTYGHDLWWRTFQDVAKEYSDVKADYNHVDACCMWMVKQPEYYDVIVTTNMFGDIITDLAAIVQGGLGVAAGGNINPDKGGTSMFEPMGGSAPKYTGKNVINPIAAINAMSMLLEQVGQAASGDRIQKAIQVVTGTKMKSQAAGKMGYSTEQVGDLVVEALS